MELSFGIKILIIIGIFVSDGIALALMIAMPGSQQRNPLVLPMIGTIMTVGLFIIVYVLIRYL